MADVVQSVVYPMVLCICVGMWAHSQDTMCICQFGICATLVQVYKEVCHGLRSCTKVERPQPVTTSTETNVCIQK